MALLYRSPAKINLFLKIVKKRADGYHNIQSIFQLIDLYDEITFVKRKDSLIKLKCDNKEIEKDNLINTAIDHFLEFTQVKKIGMDIYLKKNIPIGGGLGGGSSNAATCLLALNNLYNTKLKLIHLKNIAKNIGSDVPFFLYKKNAWVEGTGDIITPIYLKPSWFVVIFSKYNISTTEVFLSYKNKIQIEEFSYDDYLKNNTRNDFENVVFKRYPSIFKSYKYLSKFGKARMTGTGGTVFLPQSSLQDAIKVISSLPKKENALIIKSVDT